jgi:hypothetical protein
MARHFSGLHPFEQEVRVPKRALRTTVAVAVAMTATSALAATAVQAAPMSPVANAAPDKVDFNGDGITDVAVAAPGATVSGEGQAGYVAVAYGSAAGVKTLYKKVFHQNCTGIPGSAEQDDRFGSTVASGDVDGDGYTDLVVGSQGESVGSLHGAGSLTVLWGGANGLSGGTVIKGTASYQHIGAAAAVDDFNGDGHLDMATGTTVSYGPMSRTGGWTRTDEMTVEVGGPAEELWGRPEFATGDVNGDGISDLVALISHGSGELPYHGPRLVQYLQGTSAGLSEARTLKDPSGKTLDGGRSVAVGDIDRDGYADIVLGRTSEYDMRGTEDVNDVGGGIEVVAGTATGPDTTSPRTLIHQDTPGIPGSAEEMDGFGDSVSLGDTNGDGYLDLAIGAGREDVGSAKDAGSVTVLKGSAAGLTVTGARSFTQNTSGVPGSAETGDAFGRAVKLADVSGDGKTELFAGAPYENGAAGGVWAFPSTASGVTATGAYSFGAGTLGQIAANAVLGWSFND